MTLIFRQTRRLMDNSRVSYIFQYDKHLPFIVSSRTIKETMDAHTPAVCRTPTGDALSANTNSTRTIKDTESLSE